MTQLIAEYFKTQPVLKAWLFGSFSRGEEAEDSERLNHMLEAINVLINYKEHHTLEDAKSDPVVHHYRYPGNKADN